MPKAIAMKDNCLNCAQQFELLRSCESSYILLLPSCGELLKSLLHYVPQVAERYDVNFNSFFTVYALFYFRFSFFFSYTLCMYIFFY